MFSWYPDGSHMLRNNGGMHIYDVLGLSEAIVSLFQCTSGYLALQMSIYEPQDCFGIK